MSADELIQDLASQIYQEPMQRIRGESDYPNLGNPLHLTSLLIDCDTEILMNGMLGLIENLTGQYLRAIRRALNVIGASESAAMFEAIEDCRERHEITWERLRADFAGTA